MAALALRAPAPALSTPGDHFHQVHHDAHGTTVLWERASGNRWHRLNPGDAHIPAMLAAQAGQADRYISINEFHGWRLVRLLKSLRACYVDVDGCEDLGLALEALRDASMPPPTAVVWSGRGMHLYWLHEAAPRQALPVWQRVQGALITALAPIGSDPAARDCARVLRLVGSVNSKNGAEVRGLVLDPVPYDFHHLCDEVLGYRQPKSELVRQAHGDVRDLATEKARRGQRINTGSIYDRWHLVYQDLLAIAEWHFLGGIPEGHRNDWLFLSAVSLSWFARPETLQAELVRQAQAWTPGLKVGEVRDAIAAPLARASMAAEGQTIEWDGMEVDPRYRFKRATLFERLQGIIPGELAPQLRAIVSDETKAAHEREREKTRDRVAEGRRDSHQVGRKGLGRPWEELGISRATYFRKKAAGTL